MPLDDFLLNLFRPNGEVERQADRTKERNTDPKNVYKRVLHFFGVDSQSPGGESYIFDLSALLNRQYDIIEKSFILNNKAVKEFVEDGTDLNAMHLRLIRLRLGASSSFAEDVIELLRDNFQISRFACCFIESFTRIDQVDTTDQRDFLRNKQRLLIVLRSALALIRSQVSRDLKRSANDLGANFLKSIMEDIHSMWVSIYITLLSQIQYALLDKIGNLIVKGKLNCFGFLRLWHYIVEQLASRYLPKIRSALYSDFLRNIKDSHGALSDITKKRNLSILDAIVRLVDTLIHAIDIGLLCRPPSKSSSDNNIVFNDGSESDDTSPDQTGAESGFTSNDQLLDAVTAPEFNRNPDSLNINPEAINASRLFFDPTQEELERFLVKFLKVPREEAQRAAAESSSGNCLERLSNEEAAIVQSALNRLGI